MSNELKIVIYVSNYTGPQNACIGLAQQLRRRGHRVYFLSRTEFLPKFQKYGFDVLELKSDDEPADAHSKDSIKEYVKEFMKTGLMGDMAQLDKIACYKKMDLINISYVQPSLKYDQQIKHYLQSNHFSAILVDSEVFPPSLIFATDRPWFYLFCSNPVGLFLLPDLPPFNTDLSVDSDRSLWPPYEQNLERCLYGPARKAQSDLCVHFGYPATCGHKFTLNSPYLNIYQFPKELDYDDVITIPETYFGVDALCRDEVEPFQLPETIAKRMKPGDKLVYLSLGSMGSCNVDLMRRLVSVLAKTPHWYLVSKGKLHDEYELADNMWGDAFVPQATILSMVDGAILHGGNNGLTEAMMNGVPCIIMPLFYDQYNNAIRVQEKQVGRKIDPFKCSEQELIDAVQDLLFNETFKRNAQQIKQNIQERNSKDKVCQKIEQIVQQFDQNKQS